MSRFLLKNCSGGKFKKIQRKVHSTNLHDTKAGIFVTIGACHKYPTLKAFNSVQKKIFFFTKRIFGLTYLINFQEEFEIIGEQIIG